MSAIGWVGSGLGLLFIAGCVVSAVLGGLNNIGKRK